MFERQGTHSPDIRQKWPGQEASTLLNLRTYYAYGTFWNFSKMTIIDQQKLEQNIKVCYLEIWIVSCGERKQI